jgi:hypothetical protein
VNGKNYREELEVDWMSKFRGILKKYGVSMGWIRLVQELVTSFCEHDTETSGSIKYFG